MSTRKNWTKRRLRVTALACLAVATLGAAAAEEKFQKLTGGYIRAKFGGMELTDNVHWSDLYQRNGTVMSTSMGRKRTGRWRVEKDQLSLDTGQEPGGGCYEVWQSGRNVELRNQTSSTPLEAVLQKPPQGR